MTIDELISKYKITTIRNNKLHIIHDIQSSGVTKLAKRLWNTSLKVYVSEDKENWKHATGEYDRYEFYNSANYLMTIDKDKQEICDIFCLNKEHLNNITSDSNIKNTLTNILNQ